MNVKKCPKNLNIFEVASGNVKDRISGSRMTHKEEKIFWRNLVHIISEKSRRKELTQNPEVSLDQF